MADWTIVFARSARKELEQLPESHRDRIFRNIEQPGVNPRPRGVRKLKGATDLWRMRMGDYRVIDTLDDSERYIDIVAVRHRREAYR